MKCPKCGTENKTNFCMKCGYMLDKEGKEIQIQTKVDMKTTDLDIFLGEKRDQFLYKPANLSAAFFGGFYFLYRKCYVLGVVSIVLEFLIFLLIMMNIPKASLGYLLVFYAFLLRFFLYGALFNPYYLKKANRIIQKIKKDCDPQSYKNVLERRGGTSILAVGSFIAFLFLVFLYIKLLFLL